MNAAQKQKALEKLYGDWEKCERCGLCNPTGRRRKNVVFGEGNPDAHLMIVGEAPGDREDDTGTPFSGKSGSVVDGFLKTFNSSRSEVFISNIVGCRPTEEDDPKLNRAPSNIEIKACFPRIQRIIEIVDPFVVLMLGDVAFKTLSSAKGSLASHAKDPKLQQVEVLTMGRALEISRTGFVTFHPAFLLRDWKETTDSNVHWSYRVWKQAFHVADMYAQIYRGITPPDRGTE